MLVDAVQARRVLQTGSQRWLDEIPPARVRDGSQRADWAGGDRLDRQLSEPWECRFPGQPPRDGLDWDRWCGPTEPVPFHNDIFIQRSRPVLDFAAALVGRRDDRHRGPWLRPHPSGRWMPTAPGRSRSGAKQASSRRRSTPPPKALPGATGFRARGTACGCDTPTGS